MGKKEFKFNGADYFWFAIMLLSWGFLMYNWFREGQTTLGWLFSNVVISIMLIERRVYLAKNRCRY